VIEFATACAHYPAPGHQRHLRIRSSEAKARQAVIDSDHHAAMHPDLWYAGEAPYQLLTRELSPWIPAGPKVDPNQPELFQEAQVAP